MTYGKNVQRVKRVREYREQADDSRSPPTPFADDKEVNKLFALVEFAIDLLGQIEADPARRSKVIADVRTKFPRGVRRRRGK